MSNSSWPHGLQLVRGLCPWNSPGQNTGVGSRSLLQRIFPTQGSNPGLLHCRWILFTIRITGKPKNIEVGSLSPLQWIFPTQGLNPGLPHCRQILYCLSHWGSPQFGVFLSKTFHSLSFYVKYKPALQPKSHIPWNLYTISENICPHKDMHLIARNSIIHKSPKLEIIQISKY